MGSQLQIGIAGDIIPADSPLMSGQGVYSACKGDFKDVFADFAEYAAEFDFMVGNFEAVLVDRIERVSPATSAMKAPISVVPVLAECRFKYLSIANNHSMEYGPAAFEYTCGELERAGIRTFGHHDMPYALAESSNADLTTGLLSFSTVPAMYGHVPEYFYVDRDSEEDRNRLLRHVRNASARCDQLIVMPHWGSEFMTAPARWQVGLASELLQSGADAIVGAHPHVIQTACRIGSKPVYFSIGNLLSDYPQDCYRRSAVIALCVTRDSLESSGTICTTDADFAIRRTAEAFPLGNLPEAMDQAAYDVQAVALRKSVRNQLIVHLLKHPVKWLLNRGLWGWLFSRGLYLLRTRKERERNPDAVYAGPIH